MPRGFYTRRGKPHHGITWKYAAIYHSSILLGKIPMIPFIHHFGVYMSWELAIRRKSGRPVHIFWLSNTGNLYKLIKLLHDLKSQIARCTPDTVTFWTDGMIASCRKTLHACMVTMRRRKRFIGVGSKQTTVRSTAEPTAS